MSAPERTEEQTAKHNFQRDRAGITFPGEFHRARFRTSIPGKYKRRSQINDQDSPLLSLFLSLTEETLDDTFSRLLSSSSSDSFAPKCT